MHLNIDLNNYSDLNYYNTILLYSNLIELCQRHAYVEWNKRLNWNTMK